MLTIRAMQQSDLDEVYAIEVVAHRTPWPYDIFRDCLLVGYDCRVLEREEALQSEIVAYVMSRYKDNLCHILNLCVAPAWQGQGYGRHLLTYVLAHPGQDNVHGATLEVRPSTIVALHLYETMGFQQVCIKPHYYEDADGFEDGIVLHRPCR